MTVIKYTSSNPYRIYSNTEKTQKWVSQPILFRL